MDHRARARCRVAARWSSRIRALVAPETRDGGLLKRAARLGRSWLAAAVWSAQAADVSRHRIRCGPRGVPVAAANRISRPDRDRGSRVVAKTLLEPDRPLPNVGRFCARCSPRARIRPGNTRTIFSPCAVAFARYAGDAKDTERDVLEETADASLWATLSSVPRVHLHQGGRLLRGSHRCERRTRSISFTS